MGWPGLVPPTIEELIKEARNYTYSNNVSCRNWLHVARTLLREADLYQIDDEHRNDAYAFVLYNRFCDLVLEKLNKHPDIHKKENISRFRDLTHEVKKTIPKIEALHKKLQRARKKWEDAEQAKQSKKQKQAEKSKPSDQLVSTGHRNQQAQTSQGGTEAYSPPRHIPNDTAYAGTLEQLKKLQQQSRPTGGHDYTKGHHDSGHHPVSYPNVPQRRSSLEVYSSLYDDSNKPVLPERRPVYESPPPLPLRPKRDSGEEKQRTEEQQVESMHAIRAYTEGHEPLRTVFVPKELQSKFLEIAHPNTVKNLETCGILCGKLSRNAFFLTDLVIPCQISTSDTCATTDEELLLEYVDSNDLFILGWIHTHPTQTCFMSSVDMHTQSSYQIMLSEAIAIVCAPQHSEDIGYFRLTNPPGIDVIKTCRNPAQFHQHPERNIYTSALPGHVKINSKLPFRVKDLRS